MHTRQSGSSPKTPLHISRVLLATLKQTRSGTAVNISEIAQAAKTAPDLVSSALFKVLDLEIGPRSLLTTVQRIKLAETAARTGQLQEASQALTWQEFERFSEICLEAAGFETHRGVRVRDGTRAWQVDLVAIKDKMILAIDCKHWKSPGYISKFGVAIDHHQQSLPPLIHQMKIDGRLRDNEVWAAQIILTLLEPRTKTFEGVILVSIAQLSDLLEHLTPYDPDIPFVRAGAESSISRRA